MKHVLLRQTPFIYAPFEAFFIPTHISTHMVCVIKFEGGRGIMALTNIEATSLPHLKDFGVYWGL